MADDFKNYASGLTAPANHLANVKPDDGADLANVSRGILLGGAGDVTVTTLGGDTVTLTLAAGVAHAIRVKRVHATGTTATNIVVLW